MKPKTTSQKPKPMETSAPQHTSVGSGSRPGTRGKYPLKSSSPAMAQKLRG